MSAPTHTPPSGADTPESAPTSANRTEDPDLEASRHTMWRTVGRVAIVVMLLGVAMMWIYGFWGTFDVPGKLSDATFPKTAQPICGEAGKKIDALPKAQTTPIPSVRADVVDQGTAALEQMVTDLRGQMPSTEPQRSIVNRWLDDWTTYTIDRREYAKRLRSEIGPHEGANAQFWVTQSDRDNTQITKAIDHFASVNSMLACVIPGDVS